MLVGRLRLLLRVIRIARRFTLCGILCRISVDISRQRLSGRWLIRRR